MHCSSRNGVLESSRCSDVVMVDTCCASLIVLLHLPLLSTCTQEYVDHYMCHLGVGGFHRSHQCVYTDDLLNAQVVDIRYYVISIHYNYHVICYYCY
jgi:Mannitol dehydrogenase Rossmann domain